jgi:membrane fusion protein, multidrug efflux system
MNIPVALSPEQRRRAAPTRAAAELHGPEPARASVSRRVIAWAAVLLASVGIIGGLGFYKYTEIQTAAAAAGAAPEPQETVQAVRVRRGEWTDTASAVGTVVSLRQVELRNELAGTVVEVGFRSGDIVEASQVLLRLDTREEEAALAAAQAEADLARMTYERREALRSGQTVSEQAVDDARAEMAAAEARVRELQVGIEKRTIRAPFRARVGLTDLQPGAYLDEGSRVAMLQGVEADAFVDFALPQDAAAELSTGVAVTLAGPHIPGGAATATIVAEDAQVDGTSRAIRFRALAHGWGETLRPGSFVDVTATTAPPREALFVPPTAVRRASFGEHVYLLSQEDGVTRARQRIIETGPVSGQEIVVLDGLAEGDAIAGAGSFKLREGLLVQVAEPGDAPGDAGSEPAADAPATN